MRLTCCPRLLLDRRMDHIGYLWFAEAESQEGRHLHILGCVILLNVARESRFGFDNVYGSR